MAVPSYTEDLTDLDLAESGANWVEMSGTVNGMVGGNESFNAQGIPAGADPDYPFIQGSYSVTQDCTKDTAVGSLAVNNGAGTGGHGTDGAYLVWQNYMVASNIQTYANDGFMLVVGSSTTDFDVWTVGGVDKPPYPYGGWVNHAVNTTVTPDYTTGTPTATEQYIGAAVYTTTGSSKGEVHNVDVIRYGRCSSIFQDGELISAGDATDNPCTFAGFATLNDNNTNRWGLLSGTSGGYLWKGRMLLGSTNAVRFKATNTTVFIQWTPKVTPNFNLIEVQNASSRIELSSITFSNLDTTTASAGRFLMTDNATVLIDGCTFNDMDTFVFLSNATITDSAFRQCGQVTQGGSTISGTLFTRTTADVQLVADNIGLITGCNFIGDNTSHAVNLGTISSNTSVSWNNTYNTTTYASTSQINNASSTSGDSEVVLVNVASDQTLTINVTGGTAPTYRNTGAGTVSVVASVTYTITNLIDQSEVRIVDTDTNTILAGVEAVGSTPVGVDGVVVTSDPNASGRFRVAYSYNQTDAPINAKIVVMNFDYIHYSQSVILGTQADGLLVSQTIDRNYFDPP